MPADPVTELMEMAAAMHELYRSWVDAGFTDEQAMRLLGSMIDASMRNGGNA